MGQPLNYTTRQVQDVKNGMTRKQFLDKYGDNFRTHNTFYKIQRLSPLSEVANKSQVKPKFENAGFGSIRNVGNHTILRAETLLNLLNNPTKLRSEIKSFDFLIQRQLIQKVDKVWTVSPIGEKYLEAVMDNNKGFCVTCKEIKPLLEFNPVVARDGKYNSGRCSNTCKKCMNTNYELKKKTTLTKVPKKTLWEKIKSLFPKLVWEHSL